MSSTPAAEIRPLRQKRRRGRDPRHPVAHHLRAILVGRRREDRRRHHAVLVHRRRRQAQRRRIRHRIHRHHDLAFLEGGRPALRRDRLHQQPHLLAALRLRRQRQERRRRPGRRRHRPRPRRNRHRARETAD
ncbi:MAG: hypothetical protein ACK559_28210, partial [bacterium]